LSFLVAVPVWCGRSFSFLLVILSSGRDQGEHTPKEEDDVPRDDDDDWFELGEGGDIILFVLLLL
jgi:hypothetical protein